MNEQNLRIKNNPHIVKKIAALVLVLVMLPGVYFVAKSFNFSSKLALIACVCVAIALIIYFTFFTVFNKINSLKKFLAVTLLVVSVGYILINILLLSSPYFKPHSTSSIYNRFYPLKLDYTYWVDNYTQDKIVYVAKDNTYISGEYDNYTAMDYSNLVALFTSAKRTEILGGLSIIGSADKQSLLNQTDAYYLIDETDVTNKLSYFYTALPITDYDTVVFL